MDLPSVVSYLDTVLFLKNYEYNPFVLDNITSGINKKGWQLTHDATALLFPKKRCSHSHEKWFVESLGFRGLRPNTYSWITCAPSTDTIAARETKPKIIAVVLEKPQTRIHHLEGKYPNSAIRTK